MKSARTKASIGPTIKHDAPGIDPASNAQMFTRDGRFMALRGKSVEIWKHPDPLAGTPERIALWVRIITARELDEQGNVRILAADTWQHYRRRLEALGGPP